MDLSIKQLWRRPKNGGDALVRKSLIVLTGAILAISSAVFSEPVFAATPAPAFINITVQGSTASLSGLTSPAITCSQNNLLFGAFVANGASLNTITVSDSLGNSWTRDDSMSASSQDLEMWYTVCTHYGTDQVTASYSGGSSGSAMALTQYSGLGVSVAAETPSHATGASPVTTGTVTGTDTNEVYVGTCVNVTNLNNAGMLSGSYNSNVSGPFYGAGTSNKVLIQGSYVQATAGSPALTCTQASTTLLASNVAFRSTTVTTTTTSDINTEDLKFMGLIIATFIAWQLIRVFRFRRDG